MTLDNILEEINKANKIVIITHENPDGDAIGSSLAMKLALKQLGKESDVIIPEYPKVFGFLPGVEEIKKESEIESYDLAIALDCASIKLLNGCAKYFDNAKVKVAIDHHSSNTMFADYNYVDQEAPACAQLLLVVFSYFNIDVTKDIGTCILAGIITDTGGFRYDGVTAETFRFVSELCEKGIKVSKVYQQVFASKSRAKFELHKIALDRLEFFENGKVTFTYITKADEEKVGAGNGDYDGIVENGRDIEGVEVSIFLRETDKGIKGSLRSKNYVNVSEVCMMFGGGGHIRAAGCNIQGSIEQAKNQILNSVRAYLK
ncbi:MAG: bifunctional oligoribonuclease/PAP phosphatase NrnA [Clostridia bacterium]